jgi:hypothetical protein
MSAISNMDETGVNHVSTSDLANEVAKGKSAASNLIHDVVFPGMLDDVQRLRPEYAVTSGKPFASSELSREEVLSRLEELFYTETMAIEPRLLSKSVMHEDSEVVGGIPAPWKQWKVPHRNPLELQHRVLSKQELADAISKLSPLWALEKAPAEIAAGVQLTRVFMFFTQHSAMQFRNAIDEKARNAGAPIPTMTLLPSAIQVSIYPPEGVSMFTDANLAMAQQCDALYVPSGRPAAYSDGVKSWFETQFEQQMEALNKEFTDEELDALDLNVFANQLAETEKREMAKIRKAVEARRLRAEASAAARSAAGGNLGEADGFEGSADASLSSDDAGLDADDFLDSADDTPGMGLRGLGGSDHAGHDEDHQ